MDREFPEIRKVCVFGVGGVGGYFGGRIAEKVNTQGNTGITVYFVARGAHLRQIKEHGIKVITPERSITGIPAAATDDASMIPPVDLVLLCVKAYDLDNAVDSIRSMVGDTTIVLPLMNGIDIYERIRKKLTKGIVLPACLYIGTHIQEPGIISQNGGSGVVYCGKDPGKPEYQGESVKAFFNDMGLSLNWQDNPYPAIWGKYIFIAAFGLVSASTGYSLGKVMEENRAKQQVREIMKEIVNIAEKRSVGLPGDIIEQSLNKGLDFPYDARSSFQRDIESGKRDERDIFGGTIIREGAALGVPTPITELVCRNIR